MVMIEARKADIKVNKYYLWKRGHLLYLARDIVRTKTYMTKCSDGEHLNS